MSVNQVFHIPSETTVEQIPDILVALYADVFACVEYEGITDILEVGEKIAELIDPEEESSWDMILNEYKKIDHLLDYKWLEPVLQKISSITRKSYLRKMRV